MPSMLTNSPLIVKPVVELAFSALSRAAVAASSITVLPSPTTMPLGVNVAIVVEVFSLATLKSTESPPTGPKSNV